MQLDLRLLVAILRVVEVSESGCHGDAGLGPPGSWITQAREILYFYNYYSTCQCTSHRDSDSLAGPNPYLTSSTVTALPSGWASDHSIDDSPGLLELQHSESAI